MFGRRKKQGAAKPGPSVAEARKLFDKWLMNEVSEVVTPRIDPETGLPQLPQGFKWRLEQGGSDPYLMTMKGEADRPLYRTRYSLMVRHDEAFLAIPARNYHFISESRPTKKALPKIAESALMYWKRSAELQDQYAPLGTYPPGKVS